MIQLYINNVINNCRRFWFGFKSVKRSLMIWASSPQRRRRFYNKLKIWRSVIFLCFKSRLVYVTGNFSSPSITQFSLHRSLLRISFKCCFKYLVIGIEWECSSTPNGDSRAQLDGQRIDERRDERTGSGDQRSRQRHQQEMGPSQRQSCQTNGLFI